MKQTWRTITMAAALAWLITGCDNNTVINSYQTTPIDGWEKSDTLTFIIPRMKESGAYAAELGVRINSSIPFKSVTMIIDQTVFPSNKTRSDTVVCRFVDNKGKILGHGVNSYQYSFPVANMLLNKGDSLNIKVHHYMRRNDLPGISDIGIKITKRF